MVTDTQLFRRLWAASHPRVANPDGGIGLESFFTTAFPPLDVTVEDWYRVRSQVIGRKTNMNMNLNRVLSQRLGHCALQGYKQVFIVGKPVSYLLYLEYMRGSYTQSELYAIVSSDRYGSALGVTTGVQENPCVHAMVTRNVVKNKRFETVLGDLRMCIGTCLVRTDAPLLWPWCKDTHASWESTALRTARGTVHVTRSPWMKERNMATVTLWGIKS